MAVLLNPGNPAERLRLKEVQAAADSLGLQLQVLTVRDPKEFDAAFAAMTRDRPAALVVFHEHLFLTHQHRILDFAAKTRMPVMYERREYVDAGGLISYGVNFRDNFRRAAAFVDRILKGAKPADLSVEQPTRFELVVNLKTAKALGLTIPESILLRADEVIR